MAYVTETFGALDLAGNPRKWKILAIGQLLRNTPREEVGFVNGADSGDLLAYSVQRSDVWPTRFLVGGTSTADLRTNLASLKATLASAVAYQTTLAGAPVDYSWQFGDMGTTEVWEIVNFRNYQEDWRELGFHRIYVDFDLVVTQQ